MDSASDLDIDNDQLPDFRLLLTSNKGRSAAPSLPSKASKTGKQDSQASLPQSLEDQYDAFYQILQEERSISERNLSRATYDPTTGLFLVTVNKGGHFNTMGHTRNGQVYAFPEEALFLVDRGSLMVQSHGADVTVQQMWALYFESERILSSSYSRKSQSSAMDRYQVYAYLKRLGFIVTRPGIYKPVSNTTTTTTSTSSTGLTLRSTFRSIGEFAHSFVNFLMGRISAWIRSFLPLNKRPLVPHDTAMSYANILQSIRIIPTYQLTSNTAERLSDSQAPDRPVVDFEVYKPGGSFKKRDPGEPDFRVVVARAGSTLPSLPALQVLLEGQSDPDLQTSLAEQPSGPSDTGKAKKYRPSWPNLIYGIVDGAQVTFLRITNEPVTLK